MMTKPKNVIKYIVMGGGKTGEIFLHFSQILVFSPKVELAMYIMEIHQVKVVIILAQKGPTNFGYTRDPSLNNYLQF